MPHTDANFGYLALFDPEGNQIDASREDLLSIEGQSFDQALHRRVVSNQSGRYWLVSDRPGYHAMLLEVRVFHCYPRDRDIWEISYGANGIASYQHWTFDGALQHFRRQSLARDPWDGAPVPENVVEIARQHVVYRLGRTPGPDPLDLFGVRTRDAVEMRERLTEFLEGATDPASFIREIAGRRVPIFELMLAVEMFLGENGLEGHEDDLLSIIAPESQHDRLAELIGVLSDQLGTE